MSQSSSTSIFRNRFVQVIILSGALLQIGIWVRNFALLLFVMEKTGNDPTAVSLISVAEFAPIFLFSFIGGTFADRWLPKRTMVVCDLLSAVSVFIVLLTIIFGTWEAVYFVTLVSAILSQFSQPSAMKLFKVHIPAEQLQSGMAMFHTLMAVFMVIGPMLGTFIYQNFGITIAVGVMGVAFLLSAAVLTMLPPDVRGDEEGARESFTKELKEGFRYVWERKVLTILGSVFFVAGIGVGVIQPLGIFVVVERLGLPKESLQWLLVVNGLAMFAGGGLVAGIAKKIAPQKLLLMGMFVSSVTIIGIGVSTNWTITLVFQAFSGLFMPCIQIGINTLILRLTEEEFIGRVNGVLNPLFMGAMVVGMSMAGWLKASISLVNVYMLSGVMFLIGVLLTALIFNADKTNPSLIRE